MRIVGSGLRLGIAAIAGAMTMGWLGQAMAFSGSFPAATFPLGSCNVSIELDDTTETAKVILMASSFEAPGGAVYDNFHVDISNGVITPANLQTCGLTSVTALTQDGANGTFATDNYVGFSFQAVDGTLATNQYEFALSGTAATFPIFTTTQISPPPPPPPPPPVVTGPTVQQTVTVIANSQQARVSSFANAQPQTDFALRGDMFDGGYGYYTRYTPNDTSEVNDGGLCDRDCEIGKAPAASYIPGGGFGSLGMKPTVTRDAVDAAGLALALVSRNVSLSGSEAAGALNAQQQFGPLWTALASSWSDMGSASTHYTLATIGAQTNVNDFTALGFMVQADHQAFGDGAASNDTNGWAVGTYVSAFLPATGMQVQARALWGETSNEISPDGSYTDRYDGKRSLVMIDLSGPIRAGKTTVSPHLGANYSSEKSDAYTDSQSQAIPSVKTAISQATFGVNVSRQLGATPQDLTVSWGLDGVWTSTVSGPAVDYEGGRARASFGLSKTFDNGGTFGFGMFYDGVGDDKTHTTGASLNFALAF